MKKCFKSLLSFFCVFWMFPIFNNNVEVQGIENSQQIIKTQKQATPYVSYNFNNNLEDTSGHSTLTVLDNTGNPGNSKTGFGSDSSGPYWTWESNKSRGGGFDLEIDGNIGENYTIGLKFSFSNTLGGWRKIIDYKNRVNDTGFYFYNNGHLNFYNYGINGTSVTQPNQVVNLIIQRSSEDNSFKAYIVDDKGKQTLDFNINDSQMQGVPYFNETTQRTKLGFFYDDYHTSSEATPSGKVYMLKVWDEIVDADAVVGELNEAKDVTVRYVSTTGKELRDPIVMNAKTLNKKMGDKVESEQLEFKDYKFVKKEPNEDVYFSDKEQEIVYTYKQYLNIDSNDDGKADLNIDTDDDGKADLDVDTDGDGKADLDVDTDGDGKADLNVDTDGDGKADLNVDTDGDGKADLNIDTNGDGKADTNVDTDGDGKPDLSIDTDKDGKADLDVDTDGDGKADLDVDTDGDGKADLNVDTDGDGKADLNVDTDGDGKADLNVDTDGDGKADLNVDTDKDGKADLNVDTKGDGKADTNVDTDGDGKPDLSIDTDGDGKADLDVDTDGDGKPDLSIDTDKDGKADLDVDTDGDGKADLNVDTDGDGKADLNVDTDGDGKADLNVDTDGDGKADLNVDTDGDGKADLNVDTDGDGKADLNVDTDGDGKADLNVDTDGDGKADKNIDRDGDGKVDPIIDDNKKTPEVVNKKDDAKIVANNVKSENKEETNNTVKTGDDTVVGLYGILMVSSLFIGLVVIINKYLNRKAVK